MRQAVKKPLPGRRRIQVSTSTDNLVDSPLVVPKPSVGRLDERRLQRAKRIGKSHLIRRFTVTTAVATAHRAVDGGQSKGGSRLPAGLDRSAAKPLAAATPAAPKTTAELLDYAVQQAESHRQPAPPIKRRGFKYKASVGGAVALAVVLLGLIVTQNLTSVNLQAVSARAGFNASLPAYRPAGYGLTALTYGSGTISARYHSNSNDSVYTLTQKRTSWSDSQLLSDFVMPADSDYQMATASDLTVYLYGKGNATWISKGVWYTIQSDGALSDRQLLELAAAM